MFLSISALVSGAISMDRPAGLQVSLCRQRAVALFRFTNDFCSLPWSCATVIYRSA